MSVEREKRSILLGESLKRRGIKGVLGDLDDTFTPIRPIFLDQIGSYIAAVCSASPQIDPVELRANLETINDRLFYQLGVNPNRWKFVVEGLVSFYDLIPNKVFFDAYPILQEIYNVKPILFDGALETLEELNSVGIPLALVTHANQEWTDFKIDHLGIRKYFRHIQIVDQNGHKTAESWKAAANGLGIKIEETMVVGDNLSGDIRESIKAGSTNVFWINSGVGWDVYRSGTVPEGVIEIPAIGKLVDKIISL